MLLSAKGSQATIEDSGSTNRTGMRVTFDREGHALYVVDFGVLTVNGSHVAPRQGTGVLWRITRTSTAAQARR